KVIADLRKGKRLVDQYRVKTKRQLTEPIKEFEDQCKTLNEKFDSVIDPLLEQSKVFEEKERAEKLEKVMKIKEQVITDLQLVDEIADQLVIEDRYLNKSTTLKSIEEDLYEQVARLVEQAKHEHVQKELIKQHVEITNLKLGTELLESSYVHLIGHKENDEIKQIIETDAKNVVEDNEREKRLAGAKKMKESLEKEQAQKKEEEFVEVYEVIGTESQLDKLEEFMEQQNIKWSVVEEE